MDETDQWGMESESFNTFALCIGAGASVVSKDENDIPYFTMNTERFVNAFGKAMPMQTDYNTTMYVTKFNSKFPGVSVWSDCMDKTFADGRSLFNFAGLNRVTLFRSMETDFGILPVPKYDKEQEKYYNVVSQWCSNSIAIPITVTDIERTGIIIEALSAESMYTLTPAYYDIALTTKSARDEESVAMLDLIFNNRVYDLANTYDWGGALSLITSMTDSAKTDLASGLESKTPAFEKALAKFLDDVALLQ
jgi:predicted heme/steroid binding protein